MRFMQENNYQILFVESEAYTLVNLARTAWSSLLHYCHSLSNPAITCVNKTSSKNHLRGVMQQASTGEGQIYVV